MRFAKTTLLVTVAVTLTASTAWAGGPVFLDRPDLNDVDTAFTDTKGKTTVADYNYAYIYATEQTFGGDGGNAAFGAISATTTTTGGNSVRCGLSWILFEPDKVNRSKTKNQSKQQKWGGIDFHSASYTPNGSFIDSTSITTSSEKCKIKVDTKHDKSTGDVTKATWKADCKGALGVDGLDLSTQRLAKLELIFGKTAGKKNVVSNLDKADVGKDKVKIQGQCDGLACLGAPL
jgi:hypothetical protein